MKISHLKKSLLALAILPAMVFGSVLKANAAQIPYVPGQPLNSPKTPAFNIYTNIPYGVGDESDFVRLRPSTGLPTNNGANGERNQLYASTQNVPCNVGDMFDVRTYIHNGADETYNNNGTGSAIAHNTTVHQTSPLNTTSKSFTFTSSISASNAATVTDTGVLNCAGNVRLQLVPSTVYVYSKALGWVKTTDGAVNSSIKVGSMVFGSGDVWGCWDERIMVAYTVKIVEVPTPPAPVYTCDVLSAVVDSVNSNKYHFNVTTTAKNGAVLHHVSYNYGDGVTDNSGVHTYAKNGTYSVMATAYFTVNGQVVSAPASNGCKKQVKVSEFCTIPGKEGELATSPKCVENCKLVGQEKYLSNDKEHCTPCPKPNLGQYSDKDARCVEPPVNLPNTGIGNMLAVFTGTSFLGTFIYRLRAVKSLR